MMAGDSFEEDWELILPRTLVLVGKTGNGKSATGNSILGKQWFQSKRSLSAVTTTSELNTTTLEDGQTLNVIDTPGLFDSSTDLEFIKKEIVNCINMAKDGFSAFLVVISVRTRFAEDDKAAISSMLTLFGTKFCDYMIIVFTGGDELEYYDESFEEFLSNSPEALKETLHLCGNRCVLFDNKTRDPKKRAKQVRKLLYLVNMVSKSNGGKPYTNELFTELKVELKFKETTLKVEQLLAEERSAWLMTNQRIQRVESNLTLQLEQLLTERLNSEENAKIAQKEIQKVCIYLRCEFESKLKETTLKLEQLLEEEQTARLKMENSFKAAQKKSKAKIKKVELKLKETNLKLEKLTEERNAWLMANENAKVAQKKSDDEIEKVESKLKWNEKNANAAQKKLSEEARWLREQQQRANKREKKQGRLCVFESVCEALQADYI